MTTLTLEPVLETTEQAEDEKPEGLMHAWCTVCQAVADGAPIPSMCGYKSKAADETEFMYEIPDDCCMVCRDLCMRPCEKCGS